MKVGSKINLIIFFWVFFFNPFLFAEEKILSTPLINLNEIKPSFEEIDQINENSSSRVTIKKKDEQLKSRSPHAVLIGLDKITAKSVKLTINLDETKKFGPLEIKILKCGKVNINNKTDNVAYMQVKDLTKGEDEKVFIFNGWTFSSDPHITPFDHAIYDLQLVNCFNV